MNHQKKSSGKLEKTYGLKQEGFKKNCNMRKSKNKSENT